MASELNSIVFGRLAGVYRDPSRIIKDAASLRSTDLGSRLLPLAEPLVMNDGTPVAVLTLQGTLPMTFRGNEYHIPIDLYVPPQYPVRPPIIYVRPARNMTIKANHSNVGQDGMVYMPYLHNWNADTHDLTEAAVWLSSIFGDEPPCYNVDPPPPPYPHSNDPATISPINNVEHTARVNAEVAARTRLVEEARRREEEIARERIRIAEEAREQEAERIGIQLRMERAEEAARQREAERIAREKERIHLFEVAARQREAERIAREKERIRITEEERLRKERAEEAARQQEVERIAREKERIRIAEEKRLQQERADAISAATSRVQSAMESLCNRAREELRIELMDQKRLEAGKKRIDVLLEEGKNQKEKLVTENAELEKSTLVLQRWLTTVEKETQRRRGPEYNNEEGERREDWDKDGAITDLIAIPADTRSAQMLALSAESAAIDDCIYCLDMALEGRNLTMEVYLREVRKLTKRQFLAKAHLMKIEREAQAAEYR